MTVLLVRNNDCQHTDGNLMLALYSKDCAGFMSRRLKFTTWMCQLTRQMSRYQAIHHTSDPLIGQSIPSHFLIGHYNIHR